MFLFIVGLPLSERKASDFAVISSHFSKERKITEFSQKTIFYNTGQSKSLTLIINKYNKYAYKLSLNIYEIINKIIIFSIQRIRWFMMHGSMDTNCLGPLIIIKIAEQIVISIIIFAANFEVLEDESK